MGVEIERKFLMTGPPDLTMSGREIEQGYLAVDPAGTEVRLRRSAGRCLLGIKVGTGMVRTEVEVPLAPGDFEALWEATAGRRVLKTRYTVQVAGHRAEVDRYRGGLAGLWVAEVEFASPDEAARFVPPEWFGREVTDDSRYLNRHLALHGLPDDARPATTPPR